MHPAHKAARQKVSPLPSSFTQAGTIWFSKVGENSYIRVSALHRCPCSGRTQPCRPGCCSACCSSAISWHVLGRTPTTSGHPGRCRGPLPCHSIPRRGWGCSGCPMSGARSDALGLLGHTGLHTHCSSYGPSSPVSMSHLRLLGRHQDVPLDQAYLSPLLTSQPGAWDVLQWHRPRNSGSLPVPDPGTVHRMKPW